MSVSNAVLTALFCFAMVFLVLLCLYLLLKLFSLLFAGTTKKSRQKEQ